MDAACVTISDSCFASLNEDKSGPVLKECMRTLCAKIDDLKINCCILPDEKSVITAKLLELSKTCSLVITTGGTGLAARDVTPEATKEVITKETGGISFALHQRSLRATPLAALSRLTSGICGKCLIVNLPGSPKAVQECWEALEPILPHALSLLHNQLEPVAITHAEMQKPNSSLTSCVTRSVSKRDRNSVWPLLDVEAAKNILFSDVTSLDETSLNTKQSHSYILSQDVLAPEPHPPFAASIKDGYAVKSSDGAGHRRVVGCSTAGPEEIKTLQAGDCIRVSTGAPIPVGADAVIQVEDTVLLVEEGGEEVTIDINVEPKPGQDIRPIGSDINQGQKLLPSGRRVGSAETGLLASMGITTVSVFRKPRIAVMSTGNELVETPTGASNLPFGKIRDSNRIMLQQLLEENSFASNDAGIVFDEPTELLNAIHSALTDNDVLVTSGGVSMGEKDYLKEVLQTDLGFKIHFGRIFMKPGKPTTYASGFLDGKKKFVFSLPGNPVSAWVTAHLFIIPALRKMSGQPDYDLRKMSFELLHDIKLDPRPEYHRAIAVTPSGINTAQTSCPLAQSTDSNQISSRLLNSTGANLLLILPSSEKSGKSSLKQGDVVDGCVIGRL